VDLIENEDADANIIIDPTSDVSQQVDLKDKPSKKELLIQVVKL